MTKFSSDLPTLAEMREKPRACPKGASRLQAKEAEKKLDVVDERKFKQIVWKRDMAHCRKCLRRVVKSTERIPERGEVHHIHGREGELRFEDRCAILLCLGCHEGITGRVAQKWIVEPATPKGWFTIKTKAGPQRCIDARKGLKYIEL